jgi:hypothetical protein
VINPNATANGKIQNRARMAQNFNPIDGPPAPIKYSCAVPKMGITTAIKMAAALTDHGDFMLGVLVSRTS